MSLWLWIVLAAIGWGLLWFLIGWFVHRFEEHVHRNDPTYDRK